MVLVSSYHNAIVSYRIVVAEKNSDQDGIRTHVLRNLITVAPPNEPRGQKGGKVWVLEMLFHGIEGSN